MLQIENCRSIINKNKKNHDKKVILAKAKFNRIELLISKA